MWWAGVKGVVSVGPAERGTSVSVQRARAFSFFAVAPLFALAVLALNDHLLKARVPQRADR